MATRFESVVFAFSLELYSNPIQSERKCKKKNVLLLNTHYANLLGNSKMSLVEMAHNWYTTSIVWNGVYQYTDILYFVLFCFIFIWVITKTGT